MFKAIKKLLGISPAEPKQEEAVILPKEPAEKPKKAVEESKVKAATTKPKEKVASATVKTETLTVKTSGAKKADKPKNLKRETLEKMTKARIDELALERFGVELDRRKTKEFMIDEFMIAQKKAK